MAQPKESATNCHKGRAMAQPEISPKDGWHDGIGPKDGWRDGIGPKGGWRDGIGPKGGCRAKDGWHDGRSLDKGMEDESALMEHHISTICSRVS